MAIGDPYAVPGDLQTRLGKADDGTYTSLLDAASKAVERFCQRQFNTDGAASAREYEPYDAEMLAVDDFHTDTGLVIDIDGETVDLTDVILEPRNGIVEGQIGWPFFQIIARTPLWPVTPRYRPWPLDPPVITVTADWGWESVPAAIKEATLDVAEFMSVGAGVGGGGIVQSESIGDHSKSFFSYPPIGEPGDVPRVFAKAAPYRRRKYGAA